jgi:hypothetical protein
MDEQVVYSALKNGSDAVGLGTLIEFLLVGGLVIYFTVHLHNAKKNGRLLISRSARTTKLWNFLADHAISVIAVVVCLAFALALQVWNSYRLDRNALAPGNHQTIVGTLDEFRVAKVTRFHHARSILDGVAGFNSTFLEQDAISVQSRTFYVACNRTVDADLPAIGNEGRCLALHAGQQVRIDFIQKPDGSYRTEPLRVSIVR